MVHSSDAREQLQRVPSYIHAWNLLLYGSAALVVSVQVTQHSTYPTQNTSYIQSQRGKLNKLLGTSNTM